MNGGDGLSEILSVIWYFANPKCIHSRMGGQRDSKCFGWNWGYLGQMHTLIVLEEDGKSGRSCNDVE